MDQASKSLPITGGSAGSRRWPVRENVKVECRKGRIGVGPNLAETALDLGETETRLLLRTPLPRGQEVEVLFHGAGPCPVKRVGWVLRSVPLEGNEHVVRLALHPALSYAEVQRLVRPQTLR
jgi:hypothetical protein